MLLFVLFQTAETARWWRGPQVALKKLALFGAGHDEEQHCWGGFEVGGTTAGSAVLQCCRVYCPSTAGTRKVRPLQQTSWGQNSVGTECSPAPECIEGCSTEEPAFILIPFEITSS
jgi:hypothetical protein